MTMERVGRYEILGEIGRGGMAVVHRAHDPRFKRDVAVKILPEQFTHDPTFRARFEREAQAIASLEHPAIVPVYDFGEEEGRPFLVMRYMPGGSLADRLQSGPLSLAESAFIISQIATGLEMAHEQGIVHRDLKPGNILFDTEGNPHLADFGMAKLMAATNTFTGSAVIGTPAYMSPEQAKGGQPVDGRSDVYALGIILFEMITGKAPYEADTPVQVLMKHILDPVPALPEETSRHLPLAVNKIVERALAKDVDIRYQTPTQFAQALSDTVEAPAGVEPTAQTDPASSTVEAGSPATSPDAPSSSEELMPGQAQEVASGVESGVTDPEVFEPVDKEETRPAPEEEKTGAKRPLWVWGAAGILLLIVLGGGGLWLGNWGNNPEPAPTSTADRLVAAAATATTTETPAPATETAVPSPSSSPSATPSPSPTDTPTVEPTLTGVMTPTVRIRLQSVNVREGPGTVYDIVGILYEGDEVAVIAQTDNENWYLVKLPDGLLGWLAASVSEGVTSLETLSIAATIPPRPTNTPLPTSTPAPTQPPPPPRDDDDKDEEPEPTSTPVPPTPIPTPKPTATSYP